MYFGTCVRRKIQQSDSPLGIAVLGNVTSPMPQALITCNKEITCSCLQEKSLLGRAFGPSNPSAVDAIVCITMGSSQKKKKDKQKDFQVSRTTRLYCTVC